MVIQNTPTKIDKIASLRIGQRGENLATDIKMDVSDWITVHPDANYYCLFKRPDEVQVQPVLSSLENDVLTWTVRAWECAVIGVGYLEVRAVNPDTGLVAKSRVIPCAIEDSVIDDEGPVPPEMSWVGEVLAAKDTAVAAKTAAEEARDTAQTTVNGAIAGIQAEGQTQVGVVQAEGTTQVGAVQSEGTTQVGAVQAKGTEVLNSIPSDYSTLSGEVTDLNSALDYDIDKIAEDQYETTSNLLDFTFDRNLWKQGAPNAPTQQYTIYYDKKFFVAEGDVIYGAVKLASISNFRLVAFSYDANDAFLAKTQIAFNAQTGSYTVPANVAYVYFGFTTNSASIRITPEQVVALGNAAYAGSESVTATDFPARYVPTVQNISKELAYYDLAGIHMTIGCPHTISEDDVISYYDETVINYRIGTPEVHQYDVPITFTPKSGYRMAFWVKQTGETEYTPTAWITTPYTVSQNAKWAMEVARQPESTSNPADLDLFCSVVTTDVPLATLKEKISKIEEGIGSGSDSANYGVNIKYNDRTDALTQLTRLPMFLIFTDIHGFGQYLERIGDFHDANCVSFCKDVICLGDIIYNQFSDSFEFMEDSDFGKNVLLTIGNHDCYDGTTVGGVNATDLYNKFFSNVSLWNVVQPTGAAANGYCYYYKDYDNKIRIIVLNEYYWDNAQKTWFESVLESAKTAGLAVIVAQHQGNFTEAEYEPLTDYAFGTKGYSFIRYTNGYLERRTAVDSFISDGGQFVGWINGHSHAEQSGTFTINGRKQLNLTFSNAGQDSTSRMKIVNYSQDCFYYLAVDTTNKWVYVLTIGQAENKYFHRNLMLMYNYQTHEVVEYY